MDPLFELMGTLLERWNNRYAFKHDTQRQTVEFSRGEMTVTVDVSGSLLRVVYLSGPGQQTVEHCTPAEAAVLVEEILFRNSLFKVPKPNVTSQTSDPGDSKPKSNTVVECPDGSVEIYESGRKKSQQLLIFLGIAIFSVVAAVYAYSGSEPVLRRMAPMMIFPVAAGSLLFTVIMLPAQSKQPKLAIKFTAEGVVAGMQSAKWVDISRAYVKDQYTCALLSRRAGELYLITAYLDVTPQELLNIVERFREKCVN